MDDERNQSPPQHHKRAFDYWTGCGLSTRHAKALCVAGFATVDDLKGASNGDLKTLPNVGGIGLLAIYRLLGRQPPANLKEIRSHLERTWRARLGEERFDDLVDQIIEMTGGALDRANYRAAQALWGIARRRRMARLAAGR